MLEVVVADRVPGVGEALAGFDRGSDSGFLRTDLLGRGQDLGGSAGGNGDQAVSVNDATLFLADATFVVDDATVARREFRVAAPLEDGTDADGYYRIGPIGRTVVAVLALMHRLRCGGLLATRYE